MEKDISRSAECKTEWTEEQVIQEVGYEFPYHYLDLRCDEYRLMLHVDYISRLRVVKDLLKPFEGQRVLDAGCGDGRFCYELKNENIEIVGVDYSERALGFARAFSPEIDFSVQDLTDIKIADPFDAVVFIETLEHIAPADIPGVLCGLHEVLKPGGKLIVTVPSVNIPLSSKHYQHFTRESLSAVLGKYFGVAEIMGHSKIRNVSLLTRVFYWRLRFVANWLYPFRKRKFVAALYERLNEFYYANLVKGEPCDCYGLIAVCIKK